MRLRPHPIVRASVLLPIAVVVLGVVCTWPSPLSTNEAAGRISVIAACAAVTLRWIAYAGVRLHDDHLEVTGGFWSRRIRRGAVLGVSENYVFVVWRTKRGLTLFTPITPLWSEPNAIASVTEHNHAAVRTLRDWVSDAPSASFVGPH